MTNDPLTITVSLEWAKKLKEAGWEQEDSSFYWCSFDPKGLEDWRGPYYGYSNNDWLVYDAGGSAFQKDDAFALAAAPTAEEILRRLPKSVATKNRKVYRLSINCNGGKRWQIMYGDDIFESPIIVNPDESLANAAAAMWIYLKKNNLLPTT